MATAPLDTQDRQAVAANARAAAAAQEAAQQRAAVQRAQAANAAKAKFGAAVPSGALWRGERSLLGPTISRPATVPVAIAAPARAPQVAPLSGPLFSGSPSIAAPTSGTSAISTVQVAGGVTMTLNRDTGASSLSYSPGVLHSVAQANLPNSSGAAKKVTSTEITVIGKRVTSSAHVLKTAPKGSAAYRKAATDYYTGTQALKTLQGRLTTEQTQTTALTNAYGPGQARPADLAAQSGWLAQQKGQIDGYLKADAPAATGGARPSASRDPDLIRPGEVVLTATPATAADKALDPLYVATVFAAQDADKSEGDYVRTLARNGTTVAQQEAARQQNVSDQQALKTLLDPQWKAVRGQQPMLVRPEVADANTSKIIAGRYGNDVQVAQVSVACAITYNVGNAPSNPQALRTLGAGLPAAQAAGVGDLVLQDPAVTSRIDAWRTETIAHVTATYEDKGAQAASQDLADSTDPLKMGYMPPALVASVINGLNAPPSQGTEPSTLQAIVNDGIYGANSTVIKNLSATTEHAAIGSLVVGNQVRYDSPEIQQAVEAMGKDASQAILAGNDPRKTGVILSPPEVARGLHGGLTDAIGNGYGATFAYETVRQMGMQPSASGTNEARAASNAQDTLREAIGDGHVQFKKNVDALLKKSALDTEFVTKPLAEYGGVLNDQQMQKAVDAARQYDINENGGKNVKAAAEDKANLDRMGGAGLRLVENYAAYGSTLERAGAPSPYSSSDTPIRQVTEKSLNDNTVVALVAGSSSAQTRLADQDEILAMATAGEKAGPAWQGVAARARSHVAGISANYLGRYLDAANSVPRDQRSPLARYFTDHGADRIGHVPFVGPALHLGGAYAGLASWQYMSQVGVTAGVDSLENVRGGLLYAQAAGWGGFYTAEAVGTIARLDSGAAKRWLGPAAAQNGNFMDKATAWATKDPTGVTGLKRFVAGFTMLDIATDASSVAVFALPSSLGGRDGWNVSENATEALRAGASTAQLGVDIFWLMRTFGKGSAGGPAAWTAQGIYTAASLVHHGVQVWEKNKAVDGAEAAFLRGAGIGNPEVAETLANHNGMFGYATGAGTASAYLAAGGVPGRFVDYVNGLAPKQVDAWAKSSEALPLIAAKNNGTLPARADTDPYFALPPNPAASGTVQWDAGKGRYVDRATGMSFDQGSGEWQADGARSNLRMAREAMDRASEGPELKNGQADSYTPGDGRIWVSDPYAGQFPRGGPVVAQSAQGARNWVEANLPGVPTTALPQPEPAGSPTVSTNPGARLPGEVTPHVVQKGDTLWTIYGGRDGLDQAYEAGLLPSFDPGKEDGKF